MWPERLLTGVNPITVPKKLKNKDIYNINAYVYALSWLGDLILHAGL
jgi:hypothetical protein